MRVDTREQDCYKHRVFLDGLELFQCFMADEEKGLAYVFATDENGQKHACWPGRTKPLQYRAIDGVLYREVVDPHEENVVEVHGDIDVVPTAGCTCV